MHTRIDCIRQLKHAGLLDDDNLSISEKNTERLVAFLDRHPENYIGYFLLGVAYQNNNSFQNATNAYNQAIKLNPDYFHALHNLSVVYRIVGDIENAHRLLKECLGLQPDSPHAWHNLGVLYVLKEEKKNIGPVLDKLNSVKPIFAANLNRIWSEYN